MCVFVCDCLLCDLNKIDQKMSYSILQRCSPWELQDGSRWAKLRLKDQAVTVTGHRLGFIN